MNVMKEAHKKARELKAKGSAYSYRELLQRLLVHFHAKHKRQCAAIKTAFRNLYKVRDFKSNVVVAFITASTELQAAKKYQANGGQTKQIWCEQMSHGYHKDTCTVYA